LISALYSSGMMTDGTSISASVFATSHVLPNLIEVGPGGSASQVGGNAAAATVFRFLHTLSGTVNLTRNELRIAIVPAICASVSSAANEIVVDE
jgi:hypothetical protein